MRKDLKKLRQRLSALKDEGRGKLAQLEKLNGEIGENEASEEQAAQLAQLEADIEALQPKVEAAAAELEEEEKKLTRERLFAPLDSSTALTAARSIISSEPDPARTGGFHNLADFAMAVMRANPAAPNHRMDDRLAALFRRPEPGAAPTNFHQESGGTDGEGYQVPPAFRQEVYELMLEEPSSLLGMVDGEPTGSNSVQMLKDETTPWGSTGVQAFWRSEATKMNASKMEDNLDQLRLNELYAFVLATDELLEDAPRLNARLSRQSARAMNWKADEAVMWGSGVGQLKGWMNSGSLITVAKEASQPADTIVAKNVAKMYSRLLAGSLSRAVWFINSDTLPEFLTMTLGDKPIWTPPSTGFANAPGGFLFGRPVIPTEHCTTLGDKGDIMLVDPLGYYLARKAAGIQFAQSMHLFFDYGMQAFRWTFRLGGQAYLNKPVVPPKSPNAKSHFVTLAARA